MFVVMFWCKNEYLFIELLITCVRLLLVTDMPCIYTRGINLPTKVALCRDGMYVPTAMTEMLY